MKALIIHIVLVYGKYYRIIDVVNPSKNTFARFMTERGNEHMHS